MQWYTPKQAHLSKLIRETDNDRTPVKYTVPNLIEECFHFSNISLPDYDFKESVTPPEITLLENSERKIINTLNVDDIATLERRCGAVQRLQKMEETYAANLKIIDDGYLHCISQFVIEELRTETFTVRFVVN